MGTSPKVRVPEVPARATVTRGGLGTTISQRITQRIVPTLGVVGCMTLMGVVVMACLGSPPVTQNTVGLPSGMRVPVEVALEQLADGIETLDHQKLEGVVSARGLSCWVEETLVFTYDSQSPDDSLITSEVLSRVVDHLRAALPVYRVGGRPYRLPPQDEYDPDAVFAMLHVDPGQSMSSTVREMLVQDPESLAAMLADWPAFALQVEHQNESMTIFVHDDHGDMTFSHIFLQSHRWD